VPAPAAELLKHERTLLLYRARRGFDTVNGTTERVADSVASLVNDALLTQSVFMDWLRVLARLFIKHDGDDDDPRQQELRRLGIGILKLFTVSDFAQYDAPLYMARRLLQQHRAVPAARAVDGDVLLVLYAAQLRLAGIGAQLAAPPGMEWMRPVLRELVADRAALRAIDEAILEAHTTSDFDAARVLAEVLPGTTVRAMSQTRDLAMFVMRKLVLIEPIYQRGDRDHSALVATYTQQLVAIEPTPAYWPTLLRVDTRVQDAALSLYVCGVSKIPQWEELHHDVEEWMSGSEDGDLRQRLAAIHRLSVTTTRMSEAAAVTGRRRRAAALVVTRKRLTITAPQQDRMPETVGRGRRGCCQCRGCGGCCYACSCGCCYCTRGSCFGRRCTCGGCFGCRCTSSCSCSSGCACI
jgi:hypothetical protein